MKVLILGATGSVGRHLVPQALALGHEVTALVRARLRAWPVFGSVHLNAKRNQVTVALNPGGPNGCFSVSSPFARPSPVNGRVGIHNVTIGACSGFTRVTACKVAARPWRTFVPRLRSSQSPD